MYKKYLIVFSLFCIMPSCNKDKDQDTLEQKDKKTYYLSYDEASRMVNSKYADFFPHGKACRMK